MKIVLLSILLVSSLNALVFPVDTTVVTNNPKTAFRWSLVPGLCQGQMYNGSYLRAVGLFALQQVYKEVTRNHYLQNVCQLPQYAP